MIKERAVLYARISLDRTGEEIGVQRQLHELRQLAESHGFEVVAEVTENDVSASKNRRRPGYDRVWELVSANRVDHVLVWQTSRLMRSRKDRAEVINTFGKHNVDIIAVKGPSLDLRTAYGRGVADLMTSFDSMEGEVKAERVSAAIADMARRGKAWGVCPYGWDRLDGRQVVNAHEAAVVAELVDRLLAGESLAELHRDLNHRGEPSPAYAQWMKLPEHVREQRLASGKRTAKPPLEWAKSTIRTLVLRDANIAVRRHRQKVEGRFVAGDEGVTTPGEWPPIVDRQKHERVVALLRAPERRSHTGSRPGARKHLLTNGIGECGVCGGMLRVANRVRSQGRIYTCAGRGCTGRVQKHVDALVARVVIRRLAQPDALDWLLGDDEVARRLSERVEELERQLDDAADSYTAKKISMRQLERINARLMPELEAALRDREAAVRSLDLAQLRELAQPQAAARWDSMPLSAKRSALEALCIKVVLLPRAKHGPGFEPETVEIRWPNADH